MKAKSGDMMQAFEAARPDIRLYLFYGPDQSTSQSLALKMARSMGDDAERVDISGTELRGDPARLADEAASISLFGDKRYIRLTLNGDEGNSAIANLLEAETAGNPVVAIAGALTGRSKLVKLTTDSPFAMVCPNYALNPQQAEQMVGEMGREMGLRLSRDMARTIAEICAADRALAAIELEKITLYLDVSPGEQVEVSPEVVAKLAAETDEQDMNALINHVLGGAPQPMLGELQKMKALGTNEVQIVRAVQRHVIQLAELRSKIDQGQSVTDATKSVFFMQRGAFTAQLKIWSSTKLARLIERLLKVEAGLMRSGSAGSILLENELLTVTRVAERAR